MELIIAITAGLVLLAGAAPFFATGSRAVEQQVAIRDVQVALHATAETLLRGIRSATAVRAGSDEDALVLEGGELAGPCGADLFRIALQADGLHCGPDGEPSARLLSGEVAGLALTYGVDTDQDGSVNVFQSNPVSTALDDVLAVRFVLEARRAEGRSEIIASPEFVAVMRNAVFGRLELES